MKIDIDKVLIKTKELIALRERVSSADKIAGDLVLENIGLRNRAIIAENSLQQLSHRYDVDIRNQLHIRKELEGALSKAGARAITAENEVIKLNKMLCDAKIFIDVARVGVVQTMKKLEMNNDNCFSCNERYCGNCAYSNGAVIQ
ncbi:hypothetical protein [Serratia entomophila]|uniref:hypothetical protein n=1 Tax=Serratia entomophila TaxID=42906 RepID=UPI00217B03F9|nr:hypothetical protein [Serratia entomophila]CAI1075716.1 Uncharacterised protein [Serratia entomophila]CAI1740336.1 Uncharacterised protein [Serratia entomophila]CAI1760659.1 Uncharacterised protein [Serratia entomophila]CAI1811124.1 Uncharacterised protein [Serratia entomophila]CAI1856019.1 Uncharacterised protein [Serratia entomophila]